MSMTGPEGPGVSSGNQRRALVIINPLSGRGRHGSQIEAHARLAREVLARGGFDASVRPTTGRGDAHAFARDAVLAGTDLVVAWGGDGTINEAASALAHTDVPLAIVPAGSGNGLASDLGIPFDASAALDLAVAGRTQRIDVGQANEWLFFNIAGIGVDAMIAARFAERGMSRRGFAGYLQLSGAELLRYRGASYHLTIDDESFEQRAMLVAIANGRQYGNRLHIAPGARLDDGLLEVVIVDELSLFGVAWRLPALFRGTLAAGRGITMRAAQSLSVRSSGPIPLHTDGEPHLGSDEVKVQIHPRALSVRAPHQGLRRSPTGVDSGSV